MKPRLQLTALMLIACIAGQAQVTRLNNNHSLTVATTNVNNKAILYSDIDSSIWVTDATPTGTVQLSTDVKYVKGGAILNNKMIFAGRTAATGTELYITDGTVGGTALLKDIYPGAAGSVPDEDFAELNGAIYFTAETPTEGRELWKTDGTPGGTVLVKDIVAGTAGSNTTDGYHLFSTGTYLLLNVKTATEGTELWKSDGTSAGTTLLKDINPGAASSDAGFFRKYNNIVLFVAKQAGFGIELWKTNGTTSGTEMIKDINPGESNGVSSPFFFPFNNKLYFLANNSTNGDEIWSTDGTAANTTMLKDIMPGPTGSFASTFSFMKVGTKFFFSAFNNASGFELWESDGTTAGTNLFKDIIPGSESSMAAIFPSFDYVAGSENQPLFNGKFFFAATTPNEGNELWISDGTAAGTVRVKDIYPGEESGIENFSFMYTSGGLYFSANDGVNNHQLWKSDGTAGGTVQVAKINPTDDADIMFTYASVNNKILFIANDGDHSIATDLFRIDANLDPLPVSLFDFTVRSQGVDAQLTWTTAREINSKDFTVERSLDGRHFTNIGRVNAAGNAASKNQYQFVDKGVLNTVSDVVYYRLQMNDKDGRSTSSKIIALKVKGGKDWTIKLNNNPVQSNISFNVNGTTSPVSISVKDFAGRTIINQTASTGNGTMSLNADGLVSGVYILVAETNGERKTIRFVKQ